MISVRDWKKNRFPRNVRERCAPCSTMEGLREDEVPDHSGLSSEREGQKWFIWVPELCRGSDANTTQPRDMHSAAATATKYTAGGQRSHSTVWAARHPFLTVTLRMSRKSAVAGRKQKGVLTWKTRHSARCLLSSPSVILRRTFSEWAIIFFPQTRKWKHKSSSS